jgi:hypothetical protein
MDCHDPNELSWDPERPQTGKFTCGVAKLSTFYIGLAAETRIDWTFIAPDQLKAGHALDVEMQQIAGSGMLITHDGRGGMEMAPAVEVSPLQNAADGGRAEAGRLGDLIGGA